MNASKKVMKENSCDALVTGETLKNVKHFDLEKKMVGLVFHPVIGIDSKEMLGVVNIQV